MTDLGLQVNHDLSWTAGYPVTARDFGVRYGDWTVPGAHLGSIKHWLGYVVNSSNTTLPNASCYGDLAEIPVRTRRRDDDNLII